MAVLLRMAAGPRLFRYCNAGEQWSSMAGGIAVRVDDQSDEWLVTNGWTTDGRLWFCPACTRQNIYTAHEFVQRVDWPRGDEGSRR